MPKKSENFSAQFAELEKITAWFEQGDLQIEEALVKFKRGLELANNLQNYLQGVVKQVDDLKKKFKN